MLCAKMITDDFAGHTRCRGNSRRARAQRQGADEEAQPTLKMKSAISGPGILKVCLSEPL